MVNAIDRLETCSSAEHNDLTEFLSCSINFTLRTQVKINVLLQVLMPSSRRTHLDKWSSLLSLLYTKRYNVKKIDGA